MSSDLLALQRNMSHLERVNAIGQEEDMRDDFLTQSWANSHTSFSRAVADLIHAASVGFARVNRKQFDAPWRDRGPHCG